MSIKEQAQKLIAAMPESTELAFKGSVGAGGATAAMTINEIAGLVVAILTAIYMAYNILEVRAKRKKRIAAELAEKIAKELKDDKRG